MNDRIRKMAESALAGIDRFPAPVPQKVNNVDELLDPVSIAEGIYRYLAEQPVDIYEDEYIAGRNRFNGCEYTADYYQVIGHRHLSSYWRNICCRKPTDIFYWGWTHLSLDYSYILEHGLEGYMNEIRLSKQKHKNDADKQRLLEGMMISLKAVLNRCALFALKYKSSAVSTNDPDTAGCFMKIAVNCERVPLKPARTFHEAVQSVWSCFLTNPDSLGRIDQYLYPYYIKDLNAGTITNEFVTELLQELFVKVFETLLSSEKISGHNHLVVGGYLENGEDGFNELSKIILEAIADLPTYRPQASFRYTDKTTPETMKYITELNKRCQLIVFINDEPRLKGMVREGIVYHDAVNYTIIGCNEWCICGRSKMDLAHINLVHPLVEILYNQQEELIKAQNYEEVFELYIKSLRKDMLVIVKEYGNYYTEQSKDINVLTSAFMIDCIRNAKSFTDGGTRYHGLSMSFNGISNIADSMSVIRQFVFDEKLYTMTELLNIIGDNWNGHENVRRTILKKGRFFGNDDDYVDKIACDIVDNIYTIKKSIISDHMNVLVTGSFVGATLPNIILGKRTRATPDGRYDTEEFTMGISQSKGKDKNGLTSLLKSITKLDYEKFCGYVVSNLKIDKQLVDSDEKLLKLSQLYHSFLKLGGMQLQINYLSAEDLKNAQLKPEDYRNLMVRVTGYSGYFTLFGKELQNDIIKRTGYTRI